MQDDIFMNSTKKEMLNIKGITD